MIVAVPLLIASLLSVTPAEVERQSAARVVSEFERIGRKAPRPDARLERAARAISELALASSAQDAADPVSLTEAVSDAGGWDPNPRWLVVRASTPQLALESLLARHDLNEEPATHFGLSIATRGDESAITVMLSDRKAELAPFPRTFARAPAVQTLCGELLGLAAPDVFVTRPDGQVDQVKLTRAQPPSFCAGLDFPRPGRYTVEALGTGPRGPEVVALFFVEVATSRVASANTRRVEPTTLEDGRVAVLSKINALRAAHKLSPLELDPTLTDVAQAYSDRMAREHFFAHVAPDGLDVRTRVRASGYSYRLVGENLGLANGPLAAHFGIEHSPGHRKNLLEPGYEQLGVGISFEKLEGRTQAIVTEVLAAPAKLSADPLGDAYRTVATRRTALKLPPLSRNPVLEQIARDHARRALSENQPKASLPSSQVHERVFRALDDVRSAAVDLFIADSPADLPGSKSLADPKNGMIGIGAVKGSSPTYGKDKYWVVVIYAQSGPPSPERSR